MTTANTEAAAVRLCATEGCESPSRGRRRHCGYHENVAKEARRKEQGRLCCEPDCDRGMFASERCRTHYLREYRRVRRSQQVTDGPPVGVVRLPEAGTAPGPTSRP